MKGREGKGWDRVTRLDKLDENSVKAESRTPENSPKAITSFFLPLECWIRILALQNKRLRINTFVRAIYHQRHFFFLSFLPPVAVLMRFPLV